MFMQPSADLGTPVRGDWERVAARFFAAACFFPYPALAIGGNNGLQLSQALALASVPLLLFRPPGRTFGAYVLLLAPLYLSMLFNVMFGDVPSVGVLPKETISLSVAMLVLWPSQWLAGRRLFPGVLKAAALAMVVHALIGLYQLYSFANDEFPLLFLYQNPSFRSMEAWSPIYARYIKRPCGLFPEPSAMAASLGPWLVLLTGLLLDPAAAKRLGWRPGRAALAVGLGFLLIALSRSGSTFAIMAAVLVLCMARPRGSASAFSLGRILTMAAVVAAVAGVLAYAVIRLSGGFEERVASSWGLRGMSIVAGLTSNTEPANLAFGVGPGQSSPIIRRMLAGVPIPDDEGELAIFSLTVCYYMETGLVGGLAMLAVLGMALRAIVRSSSMVLGLCTLGTWLVSVAATTSYMALSAIWLCLGTLIVWDHLFPPATGPTTEGLT
jgi:hypothetical protein